MFSKREKHGGGLTWFATFHYKKHLKIFRLRRAGITWWGLTWGGGFNLRNWVDNKLQQNLKFVGLITLISIFFATHLIYSASFMGAAWNVKLKEQWYSYPSSVYGGSNADANPTVSSSTMYLFRENGLICNKSLRAVSKHVQMPSCDCFIKLHQ